MSPYQHEGNSEQEDPSGDVKCQSDLGHVDGRNEKRNEMSSLRHVAAAARDSRLPLIYPSDIGNSPPRSSPVPFEFTSEFQQLDSRLLKSSQNEGRGGGLSVAADLEMSRRSGIVDLEENFYEGESAMRRRYKTRLNLLKSQLDHEVEVHGGLVMDQQTKNNFIRDGPSASSQDAGIVSGRLSRVSISKQKRGEIEGKFSHLLNPLHVPEKYEEASRLRDGLNAYSNQYIVSNVKSHGHGISRSSLGICQSMSLADIEKHFRNERIIFRENLHEIAKAESYWANQSCVELEQAFKTMASFRELIRSSGFSHASSLTDLKERHRARIEVISSKMRDIKKCSEEANRDIEGKVKEKDEAITALKIGIEDINSSCSLLENDTAQNFSDFESIREKLKRVRENVSKFSSQTERTRADCRDAIHAEKAKLEPENRRIRGKATTSVNQKLSDCIKKENTLRREHGQILDRVESIKKLIFVTEESNLTLSQKYKVQKEDFTHQCNKLEQEISFLAEKNSNQTDAFNRVDRRLQECHEKHIAGIEKMNREAAFIIRKKAEVSREIGSLAIENEKVASWIKELMPAVGTMEGTGVSQPAK